MLRTYESGGPKPPAILFLRAGGLNGKSWLPVMQRLDGFHCLAPDLPEQGSSRDIPYSIERCVSEVAGIIRQKVPAGRAHVMALSLGGTVAFRLAREQTQLVITFLFPAVRAKFQPGWCGWASPRCGLTVCSAPIFSSAPPCASMEFRWNTLTW